MSPMPLTWRDLEGTPVIVGPTHVTPIMREHALRWPWGGLVWRRPVGLHVVAEGRDYRVPILDVTLQAACAAVAVGILFAVLIHALTHLGRSS